MDSGRAQATDKTMSLEQVLQAMDRNGDGAVDEAEFIAAGGTKQQFDEYDRNGDGVLNYDDWSTSEDDEPVSAPVQPQRISVVDAGSTEPDQCVAGRSINKLALVLSAYEEMSDGQVPYSAVAYVLRCCHPPIAHRFPWRVPGASCRSARSAGARGALADGGSERCHA